MTCAICGRGPRFLSRVRSYPKSTGWFHGNAHGRCFRRARRALRARHGYAPSSLTSKR